ncbi:hypothetical protein [Halomonas alimentaria]|uniref:Uncharacterized protein n=1 Tax=Halomonas alimentaria TaxID=147248 RepID=A0A7X5ANT7_9GAMM|nr:hypothetical protein [Halomonas alimentaria]NAW33228.1 hypothetical protein [Halomonas alimentaria]
MDMIFDVATEQLVIDTAGVYPWGTDLRAVLNRYGHTINLRGVQMRLTIAVEGETAFDMSLPPPGVRYRKTDQDVLATGRVRWHPDQHIEVSAWCRTNAGQEVTAQASFTAPRPAQPFDSWTWDGQRWQAPTPYPDDGQAYLWDEAQQLWVLDPDTPDSQEA